MIGQELDLLELAGYERRGHGRVSPARCLKGENGPEAERIVVGRAYRAIAPLLRERRSAEFWTEQKKGRRSPWVKVAAEKRALVVSRVVVNLDEHRRKR